MPMLLLSGCISPQSIRLEYESGAERRCFSYRMPEEWNFDEVAKGERSPSEAGQRFEIRKGGGGFLVRGFRGETGKTVRWSRQIFELLSDGEMGAAEAHEWQKAEIVEFDPRLAGIPAAGLQRQRRGVEFSRRSPDGRRRVVARHELTKGLLAPKAIFTVEVFEGEGEKAGWRARGTAPHLPPLDELASLRWLDDSTLMWPGNRQGTALFLCWSIPRVED